MAAWCVSSLDAEFEVLRSRAVCGSGIGLWILAVSLIAHTSLFQFDRERCLSSTSANSKTGHIGLAFGMHRSRHTQTQEG